MPRFRARLHHRNGSIMNSTSTRLSAVHFTLHLRDSKPCSIRKPMRSIVAHTAQFRHVFDYPALTTQHLPSLNFCEARPINPQRTKELYRKVGKNTWMLYQGVHGFSRHLPLHSLGRIPSSHRFYIFTLPRVLFFLQVFKTI